MRSVRVRVLVRAQTHGCPLSVGMLLVCVHDFFCCYLVRRSPPAVFVCVLNAL